MIDFMTTAAKPRSPVVRAALIGIPALAAALAAGHFTAAFVAPGASPYLAVANSVIDLSPAWLVEFAKNTFWTADKVVLFAGIALVLIGLAVFAGWRARNRLGPGQMVIGVLGAVRRAAAPGASPYLAVANSVIDLSPAWLVEFAKNTFWTADKVVLFAGIALVLIGLAVFAGWLARNRLGPGQMVIGVLGVVGLAAALSRP